MSRPARPYAPDPFHPENVDPCCDGKAPGPRFLSYMVQPGPGISFTIRTEAEARAAAIANYENPDRLWCSRCSTALEDLRDEFEDALPALLELVATIASFFPGVGTIVADIAGTFAALAAGESLSDALVDGALSAIPGGPVWAGVARAGRDILDGQRVDRSLLDGTRAAIAYEGGPLAAAAFDAVLAMCQGKSIQDAGFAGLKALAAGNTLAERAANFAESVIVAAEQGRSLSEVLVSELVSDCIAVAGAEAATLVAPLVERIKANPDLLDVGSFDLAAAFGVAEPLARAAQAVMRSGEEDPAIVGELRDARLRLLKVQAVTQGQKNAAAAAYAASTPAQRAAAAAVAQRKILLASPAHVVPQIQAAAAARVTTAIGAARPAPVAAVVVRPASTAVRSSAPASSAAPPASSTGAAGAVAVGAGVGAAGLLLAWLVWRR